MQFFRRLASITKPRAGRNARRGYTLIEILIVLAIIGMLVAIATPLIINQFNGARSDAAKAQLNALAASCELFFLDMGRYPTDDEGLNALVVAPSGASNWKGPYVTKSASLNDPWGRAYLYTTSTGGVYPYQIKTLGADGVAGGTGQNADITNWD